MNPLPSYDPTTRRSERNAFLILGLAGIAAIGLAVSTPSGAGGGGDWASAVPIGESMSVAIQQTGVQADCLATNLPMVLPKLNMAIPWRARFEVPFSLTR